MNKKAYIAIAIVTIILTLIITPAAQTNANSITDKIYSTVTVNVRMPEELEACEFKYFLFNMYAPDGQESCVHIREMLIEQNDDGLYTCTVNYITGGIYKIYITGNSDYGSITGYIPSLTSDLDTYSEFEKELYMTEEGYNTLRVIMPGNEYVFEAYAGAEEMKCNADIITTCAKTNGYYHPVTFEELDILTEADIPDEMFTFPVEFKADKEHEGWVISLGDKHEVYEISENEDGEVSVDDFVGWDFWGYKYGISDWYAKEHNWDEETIHQMGYLTQEEFKPYLEELVRHANVKDTDGQTRENPDTGGKKQDGVIVNQDNVDIIIEDIRMPEESDITGNTPSPASKPDKYKFAQATPTVAPTITPDVSDIPDIQEPSESGDMVLFAIALVATCIGAVLIAICRNQKK